MQKLQGTAMTELVEGGMLKRADILLAHSKGSYWGWLIRLGTRCYWNHAFILYTVMDHNQGHDKALIIDPRMGSIHMGNITHYFENPNRYDIAVKRLDKEWFQNDSEANALQPSHIQAYYARMLERGRRDGKGGLSAQTVKHHHRVLHEALKYAVKHGIIIRNIAEAVDPPRPDSKEMVTLEPENVHIFLDAAHDTPYYVPFYTALYTGLRRSELLGLRWRDIDLDLATLSVVQTLHHVPKKGYVFREPKTKRSRRLVDLSPSLALLLRDHRANQELEKKLLGNMLMTDDLVFCYPDGTPLPPNSVTKAFHKLAKSLGMSRMRLHDLRHTHATIMLNQGVHPKVVSERLGHSSVAITLDTYSHVLPGVQAAARRFDEGLHKTAEEASSERVG